MAVTSYNAWRRSITQQLITISTQDIDQGKEYCRMREEIRNDKLEQTQRFDLITEMLTKLGGDRVRTPSREPRNT